MSEPFIQKRVKVTLHDATLLRRGDERRHHFRLSINLSEDGVLIGLPEWIQNAYSLLSNGGNRADRWMSKTKLENMAIGFYPTERIRNRFFSQVVGATVANFVMERKGEGDEAEVLLFFSAYFPGRYEIHQWTYEHKLAECWVDFEQQQSELDLDAGQGGEDIEEAEAA